jgi:hypothetical protein
MPRKSIHTIDATTLQEKKAHWQTVIRDCAQSGLTQRKFCQRHNISYSAFQYGRKILKQNTQAKPVGFAAIPMRQLTPITSAAPQGEMLLQIKTNQAAIGIFANVEPQLLMIALKAAGLLVC